MQADGRDSSGRADQDGRVADVRASLTEIAGGVVWGLGGCGDSGAEGSHPSHYWNASRVLFCLFKFCLISEPLTGLASSRKVHCIGRVEGAKSVGTRQ
jgi:hypothetical protein